MKKVAVIDRTGIHQRVPGSSRARIQPVFGCGMDYKEHMNFGRQLPGIYAVKGS